MTALNSKHLELSFQLNFFFSTSLRFLNHEHVVAITDNIVITQPITVRSLVGQDSSRISRK